MVDDTPREAVRASVRPLNSVVVMESETLRPLNIEMCSTNADDKPMDPDRDLARPLVSEAVRAREPARDLCRLR